MTRCEIAATGNILGVLDRCWSCFPGCCFESSSQAVLLPGPWWLHRDQLTCGWCWGGQARPTCGRAGYKRQNSPFPAFTQAGLCMGCSSPQASTMGNHPGPSSVSPRGWRQRRGSLRDGDAMAGSLAQPPLPHDNNFGTHASLLPRGALKQHGGGETTGAAAGPRGLPPLTLPRSLAGPSGRRPAAPEGTDYSPHSAPRRRPGAGAGHAGSCSPAARWEEAGGRPEDYSSRRAPRAARPPGLRYRGAVVGSGQSADQPPSGPRDRPTRGAARWEGRRRSYVSPGGWTRWWPRRAR